MKNILIAFSMRNLTIGYCQGFNYIVGKLLMMLNFNEEDVFWVFTQIAENYLPFDFYIKFAGVRVDMEIVKKIIKSTIKNIDMNSELCISNLITKCFVSLFSQNVNDIILKCIWDVFFIYGNITLYRAFIWAIYLLFDASKMKKTDIEKVHETLTRELQMCQDTETLNYFLMMYNRFNDNYINHYRGKMNDKKQQGSYVNEEEMIEEAKKCDKDMSFCLCNKDGDPEKYVEYNCLCCKGKMEIIDDYFFNESGYKGEAKEDVVNGLDDLLIERHDHMCEKWLEKVQQSKGNDDDVKKEENKEDITNNTNTNTNNNNNNNDNVILNSPKHSTTNNNLQSPSPKVSPHKSPLQTHSPPSPPSPPTPPSGGYSSGGDGEGSEGV